MDAVELRHSFRFWARRGWVFGLSLAISANPLLAQPPAAKDLDRLARVRVADEAVARLPKDVPAYFVHTYHAFLSAPAVVSTAPLASEKKAHKAPCLPDQIYGKSKVPSVVKKSEHDRDSSGCIGSFQPAGDVTTATNPFFQSLGTNGRTCLTCHQPPSGMSVQPANIEARYKASHGTDAIFAGVDGANCPNNLPPDTGSGTAFKAAHSLLLKRGLFRIFLPVPTGAEYTVSVDHDPYGCNTDPNYNSDTVGGNTATMVSIYRRPRISANLNFVNSVVPFPGGSSTPAIMWDMREPSLLSQARDATLGHAQAQNPPGPSPSQVADMVKFELGFFSAQSYDHHAHSLSANQATAGPENLAAAPIGKSGTPGGTAFDEFASWPDGSTAALKPHRASIERGEQLFNTRTFVISNVAGLNDIPLGPGGPNNAIKGTCSTCHSQQHAGNNLGGQSSAVDIGIGGGSVAHNGAALSARLPVFTFTCTTGKSTPFNGAAVKTNDPGLALISGKCADLGKFSVPQLRALAAHAPYFSDGSAANLRAVIEFYDRRFGIKFTPTEINDLEHFLSAL